MSFRHPCARRRHRPAARHAHGKLTRPDAPHRGDSNVAYLISAIRHEDQVIAVMPYNRHQDYRVRSVADPRPGRASQANPHVWQTYYRNASLPLLRAYFASLFRALGATHRKAIIHRDVKPANFLYDTVSATGVLCDYGLAEKVGGDEWSEWKAECCHSLPGPSWGGADGRAIATKRIEHLTRGQSPGLAAGLHGAHLVAPISLYDQVEQQRLDWEGLKRDHIGAGHTDQRFVDKLLKMKPWVAKGPVKTELYHRHIEQLSWYKSWRPVEFAASRPPRVGYMADDKDRRCVRAPLCQRPSTSCSRHSYLAGLAYEQTVPELVASARPRSCSSVPTKTSVRGASLVHEAAIPRRQLLRTHSARHLVGGHHPSLLPDPPVPFLQLERRHGGARRDHRHLRQAKARKMRRAAQCVRAVLLLYFYPSLLTHARSADRTFQTNIPDLETPKYANLHALVKSLCPTIVVHNSPDPYGPIPSSTSADKQWYQGSEIFHAVDLMKRCLELDCTKRWTAEELLEHKFFDGDFDLGNGQLGPRLDSHR